MWEKEGDGEEGGGGGGGGGGGNRNANIYNPATQPGNRIELMEAQIVEIEKQLQDLGKAIQIFVNTTKAQRDKIKKTKAITTDTNLQKQKLDSQAGKVTAK
jgi:hypothetical protein